MKTIRFGLMLLPTGEVFELSDSEYNIANRIARTEEDLGYGGMIVMSTDVNATAGSGWFWLVG